MKKLLLFPLILFYRPVFCQNAAANSNNIARDNAIATYNKVINVQSALYNGVEYLGYLSGIESNPYFISKDWLQGSVFYDGLLYTDIPLKFDLVSEKLITKRFDGFAIELLDEKLDYFIIGTNLFKHFFNNSFLNTGYYQELYAGNLSIYAKRTKVLDEKPNEDNYTQIFEEKDKYYAVKDDQVAVIKNLKSIFDLMKDKQKKAQKYLKQNSINFKKKPEQAMIKIAEYYNLGNKH